MMTNKIERTGVFISLILLPSFLIAPNAIQSILFIYFTLIVIIASRNKLKEISSLLKSWKIIAALTGFMLWTCITFFWSDSLSDSISEIQPSLILFLLPFILLTSGVVLDERNKYILKVSYIFFSIIYFVLWLGYQINTILKYQEFIGEKIVSDNLIDQLLLFRNAKTGVYHYINQGYIEFGEPYFAIHRNYFSISMLIAVIFSLEIYFTRKKKAHFILTLIALLNLIATFYIYESRFILGLFIIFFSLFIFQSILYKNKARIIMVIVTLLTMTSVAITNKEKLLFFFEDKIANFVRGDTIREEIYKASPELFFKNPVFGIGVGDLQSYLDDVLKDKVLNNTISYNTHNMYLFYLLSGGVIGLSFFLYFLYFISKNALASKNKAYISLIIIFTLWMLIENVFRWALGSFLFAFCMIIYFETGTEVVRLTNKNKN